MILKFIFTTNQIKLRIRDLNYKYIIISGCISFFYLVHQLKIIGVPIPVFPAVRTSWRDLRSLCIRQVF